MSNTIIVLLLITAVCLGVGVASEQYKASQIDTRGNVAGKMDSIKKYRHFYVVWDNGKSTGAFGYNTENGLYPTLKELRRFVLDSNKATGPVITNIIELSSKDYNQLLFK